MSNHIEAKTVIITGAGSGSKLRRAAPELCARISMQRRRWPLPKKSALRMVKHWA